MPKLHSKCGQGTGNYYNITSDGLIYSHPVSKLCLICWYRAHLIYHRVGNFHVKKLSYDKFLCKKIFVGTTFYHVNVNSAQ